MVQMLILDAKYGKYTKKSQNLQAILEVVHQNLRYFHDKNMLFSMPFLLYQVSDR